MSMVFYFRRVDADDVAAIVDDEEKLDEFFSGDEKSDDLVDFDVAWHVVHFLLTGTVEPTGNPLDIILEGYPAIGEGWMEEQTALIPPEAMQQFHIALSALSDEELKHRFERREFVRHDVYNGDLFADEADGPGWDYIYQGIPGLRRLAEQAVAKRSAVLRLLM